MLPGYLCGRAGFVRVEMHTNVKPGGDAVRAHYWKKFTVVENCERPKELQLGGSETCPSAGAEPLRPSQESGATHGHGLLLRVVKFQYFPSKSQHF